MKRVLAILAILIVLFVAGIWFFVFRGSGSGEDGPKPPPLTVSKHSEEFNHSANAVLSAYYGMTEAFVNWDTAGIRRQAGSLKTALEDLKIEDLQKDTAIYETSLQFLEAVKAETDNILRDPSIDRQRSALNILTDNLRTLMITVKYDQAKIYYQECPMAFGDDVAGYWLSATKEVRNPYLGTKHPEWKDDMLHCGGPKDTINFMQPDTTGTSTH